MEAYLFSYLANNSVLRDAILRARDKRTKPHNESASRISLNVHDAATAVESNLRSSVALNNLRSNYCPLIQLKAVFSSAELLGKSRMVILVVQHTP